MSKFCIYNNKSLLTLGALVLIFVVFIGLGLMIIDDNTENMYSQNGVWDLSQVDFTEKTVRLQGDVEHIPGVLLAPEEFDYFLDQVQFGETKGIEISTSRLRVVFPNEGWYTFSSLLLGYSHRLYVNGEKLWDVGSLGCSQTSATPGSSQIIFTARPENGYVEIVMQSLTYLHRMDTLASYWTVGNQSLLSNVRRVDFVSSLVLGCFLSLFMVFVILYFLRRDYIANLYIALLSLILMLRFGVREPSIFSAVFSNINWYVEFRVEYVTVPVMGVLLTAIATELLPEIVPKYFRIGVHSVSFIFVLILLFANASILSYVVVVSYIFYMVAILHELVHGIYVVFRDFKRITLEQGILIFGFALVIVATYYAYDSYAGINMLSSYTTISTITILLMAHILFCFCIGTAVFISNTKDMDATKAVEYQLAAEVNSLIKLNQTKSDLMENISHEARTPLAVLASYSGLVAMELKNRDENEQIVANLDKIVEEAKRVANLIESMNKFTFAMEKHKTRVDMDLGEMIKQTADLYHHIYKRNGIAMHLTIDDGLWVFANPEELTQVLFNLLQNVKNHGKGTMVSIIAAKDSDANNVVVAIGDTGTGVAPELLPHLFERGVSGTTFGKGIGLAICKDVMDAHDGTITIESEVGKGTTVVLTLPAVNKEDKDGSI